MKSTLSLPLIFSKKNDVFSYDSLLPKKSQPNFITLRLTSHPWWPWLLFTGFCRTFSTISYLDMLFLTKKILKIFDKSGMRNIHQEISLIWWISPLNIMIFGWKFYHNFFIILPTYPPNFSPFEVSLAETEFWRRMVKSFSIFLSWRFFDLLSDFSRSRLIQYI